MITVICGTHRPQNQTQKVVEKYAEILKSLGQEVRVFYLDDLPEGFLLENTFDTPGHGLDKVITEKIEPSDKFVVISPEYNGSYPGLFKAFLDAVPPRIWRGKKVALVGVASGRAGNLRGMDHLTDVFHYLRAEVFSLKIPISRLNTLMTDGEMLHQETIEVLEDQARQFLHF